MNEYIVCSIFLFDIHQTLKSPPYLGKHDGVKCWVDLRAYYYE